MQRGLKGGARLTPSEPCVAFVDEVFDLSSRKICHVLADIYRRKRIASANDP